MQSHSSKPWQVLFMSISYPGRHWQWKPSLVSTQTCHSTLLTTHPLPTTPYLITATIASEALIHPTAIPWLVVPVTAVILIITHLSKADAHLAISAVKLCLRVALGLCYT